MSLFKSRFATVFAAAVVLVVFSSLSAVGASMITSSKIKDGTIRSVDIHNGTIGMRDLNQTVHNGIDGDRGPQGPQGPAGPPGTARYVGPNWSIVDRNVIGNGDSYLRSGPGTPPLGMGSLGLRTGSSSDKAVFGDQSDFYGETLASLSTLKYSVFATGEDLGASPINLPNLQFEVNPHLSGSGGTYSTLIFVPTAGSASPNAWSELDASTAKQWYLTGNGPEGAGTTTGCNDANYCTLAQVKAAAPDATLLTAQISKGRDWAFSGAVDKLVINDTTYDFEPFGVSSN
jgi:hypothetical protein